MPSDMPWLWPSVLILAAAVSLGFVVRRIRHGELEGTAAAGAVLFRVGLVLVGVVYLAALPYRAPAALFAALGIAALGAILNLVAVLAARRRIRRRSTEAEPHGAPAPTETGAGDTQPEEPL